VLTSINADMLREELKVDLPLEQYVAHLARLAQQAGLDGVVASPREIGLIRQTCGAHFIILTPGIRPRWSVEPDDQQRVTTPREALEQGSDYIVVGRPILSAANRIEAARRILAELEEADVSRTR
ncbi:MAG: orotidine-5'-phosphate decarboxylase, partial [Nitrospinota bacterium]